MRPIRCLLAALVLFGCVSLIGSACAGAVSAGTGPCPLLPINTGFVWKAVRGPDFDVCYGKDAKSGKQLIGVYEGNFPSFDSREHAIAEQGSIAGTRVQWYVDKKDHPYSRATVFEFRSPHGWTSHPHVWISAENAAEMARVKAALEAMQFR